MLRLFIVPPERQPFSAALILAKQTQRGRPDRDEVALVVNSAFVRTQDQLHIHADCLCRPLQTAQSTSCKSDRIHRLEFIIEMTRTK